MLIDFHTHIYPEKLASRTVETLGGKAHIPHFTDGTLGSLTALMDREGVDRFVLLHIATSPKNEGNVNAFARQTNSAPPSLVRLGASRFRPLERGTSRIERGRRQGRKIP